MSLKTIYNNLLITNHCLVTMHDEDVIEFELGLTALAHAGNCDVVFEVLQKRTGKYTTKGGMLEAANASFFTDVRVGLIKNE